MIPRKSKSAPASSRHSVDVWQVYAIGAIVCAGMSVAAYLFGVQPALATHDADAAYAADLETRRQNANELGATLASARQNLEQTRRDVAGLSLRLEPAAGVNQRLAKLADLAIASGLQINEVQPGAPTDSPHYQVVPIRISGTGTYPACALFLHQLRQRFPDTAARGVDAANLNPTRDHPAGSFRFELSWYTAPLSGKGGQGGRDP